MVIDAPLWRTILICQLIAAGAICASNLSVSVLNGVAPFVTGSFFVGSASCGTVFLFLASGFLTHGSHPALFPLSDTYANRVTGYICRRFWRLAPPVFAALLFDKFVVGYSADPQASAWISALPLVLGLGQTWTYNLLGPVSVPLPLGPSNMAWVGSDLFFVSILYALSHNVWSRMGAKTATIALVVVCLLSAAQYWLLCAKSQTIAIWAALRFGSDLSDLYTLSRWLLEFCPYIYVGAYFSGVLIAQMNAETQARFRLAAPLICAIGVTLSLSSHRIWLGLNLLLLTTLVMSRGEGTVDSAKRPHPQSDSTSRLASCAYELLVLHLVFFDMFAMSAPPPLGVVTVILLVGRVAVVSCLTLLLCFGLGEQLFTPLRRRINHWFGLAEVDDQFA